MSEKDSKMLPGDGQDSLGKKILSILDRVPAYNQSVSRIQSLEQSVDAKSMEEKSASSPDSAIDLTEDNKHLCDNSASSLPLDSVFLSSDIIESVLDDVLDSVKRRERKKKREKFTDSEKWNLLRQESTIGWKRILSRNSDEEGGWGFNFISPKGLKLTIKELEKFLKKKKLDIDDLVFEAHKIELNSHPRKKAVLKIGYPLDKIRDLKLPKRLEMERKRKLAQMRAASQPSFKSISEFLASLDQTDCQSYASDDTSFRDLETDDEENMEEDTDRSRDQENSFNISVESVSEEYGLCSQMLDEVIYFDPIFSLKSAFYILLLLQVIHNVVMMSDRPPGPLSLISPNTRIRSLAENMAAVQLTLSSMIHNTASPRSVEKLKIRIADRQGTSCSRAHTPVKFKTDLERLKASRVSVDGNESLRIGKHKVNPERLKDRRSSSSQDYVSEMNTPTSLKIRKPSGSPERPLVKIKLQSPLSVKKTLTKYSKPGSSDKQLKAKKFSIFKTRNRSGRDENAVNFTDKTVGKKLNIRRSSKDPEVINGVDSAVINDSSKKCRSALKIDIDDDMEDLDDEFTQQASATKCLESPQSKMMVVQSASVTPEAAPVRRNIFGPHSPACKDEISPEKGEPQSQRDKEDHDKGVRPASRTQSRVLSNEDAIKAIDAVVTISEIQKEERRLVTSTSSSSPATPLSVTPCPSTTPSLPLLSPHELPEESRSNMTTPSLPSLSPAIRSSQVVYIKVFFGTRQ